MVEMTPELKRKNMLTALACLGFVGGVYMYSIRKLKEVSRHSTLTHLRGEKAHGLFTCSCGLWYLYRRTCRSWRR